MDTLELILNKVMIEKYINKKYLIQTSQYIYLYIIKFCLAS
jgi:hypothetical protein